MSEQDDIRYGQGVWCLAHGNGVIDYIDYATQEAWVKFYNKGNRECFSFGELEGNWNWKQKQWQLSPL